MNRPNLFSYATSELSQDAFLCWVLNWADPNFKQVDINLHNVGVQFIEAIFKKHNRPVPPINSIQVEKQVDALDILAVVNDEIAILIEDKTYTSNHSNQLERYREAIAKRGYPYEQQLPIYFKIAEQGDYSAVIEAGYQQFSRKDMLAVLKNGVDSGITDSILIDYNNHLLQIEESHESYQTASVDQWKWAAWKGFYSKLQELGIEGKWDYVSNPRGGFNGFWWHWKSDSESRQYIQLEHEKLCIKIEVQNKDRRIELRNSWSEKILEHCSQYHLDCKRPERFGNGRFMTVAVLDDYRAVGEDGAIDMDKTIQTLRNAEKLLNEITKKSKVGDIEIVSV